jgi:valyl-tRNA synthetase
MRLGLSRVETCRNFGTKLWNATRVCEMNECITRPDFVPAETKARVNRWILSETARVTGEVTRGIEAYRFNDAAAAVYHFVYDVYCDWYLEFIKPVLNGNDEAAKAETRATAAFVRDQIFKLLHPFMPFITEELWARTAEHGAPRDGLLMLSSWPDVAPLPKDAAAEAEMQWLIALIASIRSVRAEMNVPAAAKIALVLKGAGAETRGRLERHRDVIMTLARLSSVRESDDIPSGSAQFVIGESVAALPLGEVIDLSKERQRLQKEIGKADGEIAKIDAKLSNQAFVSRAPEEVIEEQKERRAEAEAVRSRLAEALGRLS